VNPSIADRHRYSEHGQSRSDKAGRLAPIARERGTH